jgi:membrane protein DedA with SNARE-associated domain
VGDDQGALNPDTTLRRRVAIAAAVLAAVAAVFFTFATQRSYILLRSAQEAGAPRTSAIRAWMSLDYIARSYEVPVATLIAKLDLPPDADPQVTIRATAERVGIPRFEFVQRVQKAVASSGVPLSPTNSTGWVSRTVDAALSAVITFGYPGYAAIRFLGSLGIPLPDGIASVLAGSLAFQDRLAFWPSIVLGALAAVAGDLAGYALGVWGGQAIVARYGARIGLTQGRRAALEGALDRWGVFAVLVTRTLAASLGGPVNLLAGIARYAPAKFLFASGVGRLAWTLGYEWLGYAVGADAEAGASFLRSLLALLLAVMAFGFAIIVARRSAPAVSGS